MLSKAGIPSSMIDLSDGLLADLGHILEHSGTGARINVERIPCSQYFRENAGKLCDDPMQLSLSGGEDYELLFTVSPDRLDDAERLFSQAECRVSVIGEITAVGGLQTVSPDGELYMADSQGFRHF
jgi:thiamine-monophosphate kinase